MYFQNEDELPLRQGRKVLFKQEKNRRFQWVHRLFTKHRKPKLRKRKFKIDNKQLRPRSPSKSDAHNLHRPNKFQSKQNPQNRFPQE